MDEINQWKTAAFEDLVSDERVHALVWHLLEVERENDNPRVLEMDITAARKYLRACIFNMGQVELGALGNRDAASLWARGALGAAKYRMRKK